MADELTAAPPTAANASDAAGTDERSLRVEHVYKVFVTRKGRRQRAHLAVRNVSLDIRPGEFITFVGPSGCGKSTVLNMLAGLEQPSEGALYQGFRRLKGLNTNVGYITQDDNLLPWRTLLSNVELALELKGVKRSVRRERAHELLGSLGLGGFEHSYPHQLSGGMRKRGSIARTLLADDPVILMDEPFGPLDAQTRLLLQDELLRIWTGSGKTIVFVTHDLVEAIALSDRIVLFTSVPGSIRSIYSVDIPRPRDVFHIHEAPGFSDLFDTLWDELRVEIDRVREA
ncbi:MAG TPA: ABC transporter ATP-binding protein [Gaiellaceae bacterium]|jgi:NitT/TauT family transport system ATP-binding protein